MRMLDQEIAVEHARVAQMLQNGRVYLGILLQPGVSGKLKKGQQREAADRGNHRQTRRLWRRGGYDH